jgi:ribulose-phosphate 3-epimerase
MVTIIPTINVQSQSSFVSQLREAELLCPIVQIDIADGIFTSWKNWNEPNIVKGITTKAQYEIHLMVQDVEKEIEHWKECQNIKRIIIPIESFPNLDDLLKLIKKINTEFDFEVGISLNPNTPIEILGSIADKINFIMLLGVTPGTSGQPFQEVVMDKIQDLKIEYPELTVEVDGGINEENIRSIIMSGANIVCLGSKLFNSNGTFGENYNEFLKLIS